MVKIGLTIPILSELFVFLFCRKQNFRERNKLQTLVSMNHCAKKVVSNSLGLVDFAIGLVNSVFNLPYGQVMFFEQFDRFDSAGQKVFGAS